MTRIASPQGYDTVDIMVDIDDVIVPWFETVDQECRRAWGDHPNGPCRVWSMWEHYGRTQDEWSDVVVSAVQTGLYTSVDPIPGSVEAINRLRWFGHRIHLVTARGFMSNAENIRRWTPEYMETFGIGYDNLLFEKKKVAAQRKLGVTFDYAIDDGGHNFDALAKAGVDVYLCEAPHNGGHWAPANRRVKSLWEFSELVLEETVGDQIHVLEATG